jgi:glycosyltransferase involved in cell wall biosynthesis
MLVIHNGSKIENFVKEFSEHGVLKVLFAGRVERSKGIMILLSSVRDLDVELIIAGNGSLLEEAKHRCKELRIEHKVKFLGKLDIKQLNDEYKKDKKKYPGLTRYLNGYQISGSKVFEYRWIIIKK